MYYSGQNSLVPMVKAIGFRLIDCGFKARPSHIFFSFFFPKGTKKLNNKLEKVFKLYALVGILGISKQDFGIPIRKSDDH